MCIHLIHIYVYIYIYIYISIAPGVGEGRPTQDGERSLQDHHGRWKQGSEFISLSLSIYIYIYIIYVCMYVCIYIYIYWVRGFCSGMCLGVQVEAGGDRADLRFRVEMCGWGAVLGPESGITGYTFTRSCLRKHNIALICLYAVVVCIGDGWNSKTKGCVGAVHAVPWHLRLLLGQFLTLPAGLLSMAAAVSLTPIP